MRRHQRTPVGPFLIATFFILAGAAFAVGAEVGDGPVERVDLSKIPRTIAKEPDYQTDLPGYCLLVFGQEAEMRVWLVVDGDQVYIDRNGNGDLTEADERVTKKDYHGGFELGDVIDADGRTKHDLNVFYGSEFELEIGTHWTVVRRAGRVESVRPKLAEKPTTAPIIHPNGPLTLAPFTAINFAFRNVDEDFDPDEEWENLEWLNLVAGSPGLGPGTFTVYCAPKRLGCNGERKVLADIVFPSRMENETIKSQQELTTAARGPHFLAGPVRVPDEAAGVYAKLRLAIEGREPDEIIQATIEKVVIG